MKTYSLSTPPTCAGIYYLANARTGQLYVGQTTGLRRRYNEWKNALSSGFGHTNVAMHQALTQNPDLDEWKFIVVKEIPGASLPVLIQEEADEIARVGVKLPGKIINSITPSNPNVVHRVELVTDEGGVVGQGVAARMLGRNTDTIRDKVRWLRDQGIGRVNVSDLIMDRREILKKYS